EMGVIKKDFLPHDLKPLLQQNNFDGCVAVQADQSEEETMLLIELAKKNDFIKGVVGWVDLKADDIEKKLEHYRTYEAIKGFRHVLQGEKDRKFMLSPQFKNGIGLLQKNNFTYDILIYPDQLKYTKEFVAAFPEQKFVIDHLAKPDIRNGNSDEWKADILALAMFKNVYCKISGMVTEAHWNKWKQNDFVPYIDTVVKAFGPDRLMFGSDWPACLVAASYKNVVKIVSDYFSSFSKTEQGKIFGENAIQFYNLRN
ncbi:MAG: amidohydrolase family protein, partial [Ginsengibacter sp.]